MQYEVEVQYTHTPGIWKRYAGYQTLHEALAAFHRLETHEACANVRVLVDGQDRGIIAR